MTLVLVVALAIGLMFIGTPIFVIISGLTLFLFFDSQIDISAIIIEMHRMATTPVLVAIPLFTFAGYLLSESRAPKRLIRLSNAVLGWLPGGLAVIALFCCAIFTALTGATGLTIIALGGILLPVILGWVPIYIAAVVGAALMVLFGCLTMEEAYRQIEWKAVFLIAGLLPLGTALDQTGAARLIAEGVVALVGPFGPKAVMFGMVALTFIATCFVPTAALVVLMAPIALNTATNMGLSPYAFMMAVAMAASASFTTPISHPANILVMGPGGYRFVDYLKVGGLLTLVILVVLMVALPVFWPLAP